MKNFNLCRLAAVALLTIASTAFAQVPTVVHYQGNLTDDRGNPINRSVSMQFKLYNDLTGGTSTWEETHSSIAVAKGLFSVALGSRTTFPKDVFSEPKYLEIVIGGEILSPRQRLGSAPYAVSSRIALGQIALSNNLGDIEPHAATTDIVTTLTLINENGPVALLNGVVHGTTNVWTVRITVDGITSTTLSARHYEDSADHELGFVQLPPIMANVNLKVEIITTVSGKSVSGYAWTKKL